MLLNYSLLDGPDGRLLGRRRVDVVAIQVLGEGVESVVTAVDAIGIEHRNDLKYEPVPEYFWLYAFLVSEEFPDAVEHKRSGSFTRVHSGSQEDRRFVELEWPFALIAFVVRE